MFKTTLIASAFVFASMTSFANDALEKKDAKELKANYALCAAADSSWMRRFGNYVVGYDLNEALDLCRKKAWPQSNSSAARMGCHIDGQFIVAGYYCISR